MADLMNCYKHVKVYRGDFCGVGKSDRIRQRIAEQDNGPWEYQRIPIYGEIDRDKLIEIHK
jgi:hypothetical protein